MTKREVLEKVHEQNLAFFSEYGFVAGSKSGISKNLQWGELQVGCEVSRRKNSWRLRYYFLVIHREIESVKQSAKWDFPTTATITVGQYELAEKYQLPEFKHVLLEINSLPEITFLTQELQAFWEAAVLPFFRQFKCLKDIDAWFNQPLIQGSYDWKRAAHLQNVPGSLISAYLNKNPMLESLRRIWEENLGTIGVMEKLRKNMHKLMEYLREKPGKVESPKG